MRLLMKLLIVNGSPRGKKGNTETLLNHFIDGFQIKKNTIHELYYLNKDDYQSIIQAINGADIFILALPLYVSSMPGMVKEFIEHLSPLSNKDFNPTLGFIVQSGFPEAIQSRCLEKYFEKLSARLRCNYLGTIIKGHCGTILASGGRDHLLSSFYRLGKILRESGRFDGGIIRELAQPEQFSMLSQMKYKLQLRLGFLDGYYNNKLKENDVFEKRLDMPYADPDRVVKWYLILLYSVREFLRSRYEHWTRIKGFRKRE
jgi:hypothetical protein